MQPMQSVREVVTQKESPLSGAHLTPLRLGVELALSEGRANGLANARRRRGRRGRRGPACVHRALQDGDVEGVDGEDEAVRRDDLIADLEGRLDGDGGTIGEANGVADLEALEGGRAFDSGLHNENHQRVSPLPCNLIFQKK